MAIETNVLQGSFTSDGNSRIISLRSDVDWMWVYNQTQIATPANVGLKYYWQRGMAVGTGFVYTGTGGANTLTLTQLANPNGFTLVDSSGTPVGAAVATVSSTNATQPVVATGDTTGLVTGSIVRLANIAAVNNICGIDFEIDTVVASTSFRVRYALANAPGAVGGAGVYRRVVYDPIYYPRRRFIANITQAASAVVTTTVQHGYTVGQDVRFSVSAPHDMTEINGLLGTITAVTASTFTVNIDSSGFTAFAFPVPGDVPYTPATVTPLGIDTAQALSSAVDILGDETENLAQLGMSIGGGASTPGGANNDVMYWLAGKSFSVV